MKIKIQSSAFRMTMIFVLTFMSWSVFAAVSCKVKANPPLRFGNYDPGSATPIDRVGSIKVKCKDKSATGLISYNILLSAGSGSYTSRQMFNGSDVLTYNLYTNASFTTVWGDGTGDTSIVSDSYQLTSKSETRYYSVYGRMTVYQNVPVGHYTDVITVTINY